MTRLGRRAIAVAAALAAIAGCVELGGPTEGVVAISDLRLPYPSVVIGDLLRDSLGVPTPLTITAFGPDGQPIPGVPIAYVGLDSSVLVGPDGAVVGVVKDTLGGRVLAGTSGLQTPAQRVIVTIAPTVAAKSVVPTAIVFDNVLPDSTNKQNWSPALDLTLTGVGGVPAQGYVVVYSIVQSPPPKVPGTPTAYITNASNVRSPRDTTDTQGVASRFVVLRQSAIEDALRAGTKTADTIVVRAKVKYLGADVPGSPIDFIVPVSKKP